MNSSSLRSVAVLAAGTCAAVAAPASAAEYLAAGTLQAPAAKARTCHSTLLDGGKGVVQRSVRSSVDGVIQVRLSGARRADWDVAVFDRATRGLLAASAHRGTDELAEGFVSADRDLVVQACRVSGRGGSVRFEALSAPLGEAPEGRISLVRVLTPTQASKDALHSLELDETEHARDDHQDVVLYGAADAAKLRRAGLLFTTIVKDLPSATRAAVSVSGKAAMRRMGPGPGSLSVPSGRTAYRRLADYSADLKKLAAENPGLVKPITLPHASLEGRPVEGVEITRNVDAKDGKPVHLNMGVHHAREWPSGEHAMEFAFELVNGAKAGDARITALLDKVRVIVVPIVNPDGFNLSREATVDTHPLTDSRIGQFAYKRRNCRMAPFQIPQPGACAMTANRSRGVDPNRNYGGFWGGPGASSSQTSDIYWGHGPFSEPETQNVRELISARQATTVITNHTYSDLVLRPPGLASQGDPPDEPVYKALGDAMAAENGYTSQKSWQLYDTTGTTEDWSYTATGGLGFTFEIGKAASGPTGLETLAGVGFHPPYPVGVAVEYSGKYPTGGGNRAAYLKALEATANPALHSIIRGTAPAGSVIRVHKTFLTEATMADENDPEGGPIKFRDTLDSTMVVPDSGEFEYHVNPSTRPFAVKGELGPEAWTLTCERDGKVKGEAEVFVDRGETVDVGDACS